MRQTDTKEVGNHFFQVNIEAQESDVLEILKQIYNQSRYVADKEFAFMSQEDKKFLQIKDEGTKLKGGHYKTPLPFRNGDVALPNKIFAYIQRKIS